jgi:hypothetical protein
MEEGIHILGLLVVCGPCFASVAQLRPGITAQKIAHRWSDERPGFDMNHIKVWNFSPKPYLPHFSQPLRNPSTFVSLCLTLSSGSPSPILGRPLHFVGLVTSVECRLVLQLRRGRAEAVPARQPCFRTCRSRRWGPICSEVVGKQFLSGGPASARGRHVGETLSALRSSAAFLSLREGLLHGHLLCSRNNWARPASTHQICPRWALMCIDLIRLVYVQYFLLFFLWAMLRCIARSLLDNAANAKDMYGQKSGIDS